MPAQNPPNPRERQASTQITMLGLQNRINNLETRTGTTDSAFAKLMEHERTIAGLSPEAGSFLKQANTEWRKLVNEVNNAKSALKKIQDLNTNFEIDTGQEVFRDQKLKDAEYRHERRMKLQALWIAVLQRAGTTLAIVLVMVAMLGLATHWKWPVPRLIAPVPAGTNITCPEVKGANLEALQILFGTGSLSLAK